MGYGGLGRVSFGYDSEVLGSRGVGATLSVWHVIIVTQHVGK